MSDLCVAFSWEEVSELTLQTEKKHYGWSLTKVFKKIWKQLSLALSAELLRKIFFIN